MANVVALNRGNYLQAFELLTRQFVEFSQPHRALGIELDEYRQYLEPSFRQTIEYGASYFAIDTDGAVMGCVIACDYLTEAVSRRGTPLPVVRKMHPLQALLAQLNRAYLSHRRIADGDTLLVDMAAVDPRYGGRGVYTELREAVHERAREQGFRYVVGELSSAATQWVCIEKLEQQVIARLVFADFEYAGTRPFEKLLDPPEIVVVEGAL